MLAGKIESRRTEVTGWCSSKWASYWSLSLSHFSQPHRDSEGANLMLSRTCRRWKILRSWPTLKHKRWRISRGDLSSTRWGREDAAADDPLIVCVYLWCFSPVLETLMIVWRLICARTLRASKAQRCLSLQPSTKRILSLKHPGASNDQLNVFSAFPVSRSPPLVHCHFDLIVDAERDRIVSWNCSLRQLQLSKWATKLYSSLLCIDFHWTHCCPRATSKRKKNRLEFPSHATD